jgi:hypothetical protein
MSTLARGGLHDQLSSRLSWIMPGEMTPAVKLHVVSDDLVALIREQEFIRSLPAEDVARIARTTLVELRTAASKTRSQAIRERHVFTVTAAVVLVRRETTAISMWY